MQRTTRSNCRRAARAMQIDRRPQLEALTECAAQQLLGDQWKDPRMRNGVRTLLRQLHDGPRDCIEPWVAALPQRLRIRVRHLQADLLALLGNLGFRELPWRKKVLVLQGLQLLGIQDSHSLRNLTVQIACAKMQEFPAKKGSLAAVHAVLLLTVGKVNVSYHAKRWQAKAVGIALSRSEQAWMAARPEQKEWYMTLKGELMARKENDLYKMLALVRTIDPGSREQLQGCTAMQFKEAIPKAVLSSLQHCNSLLSKRRITRAPNHDKHAVGRGMMRGYIWAAKGLCSFFGIRVELELCSTALWRQIQPSLPRYDDRYEEFVDVIAGADLEVALQCCTSLRERLVLHLCGHLGMRIGAVRSLRIAGVAFPTQGVGNWAVRDEIIGRDKGKARTSWILSVDPGLPSLLSRYINEVWRPTYERWIVLDGETVLKNGNLFPCAGWETDEDDMPLSIDTMGQLVKRILKRAGVTGPRAHPHALRKGFCTELLRAGNDPKLVSQLMGHSTVDMTITNYDKRPMRELMANMRRPRSWHVSGSVTQERGAADNSEGEVSDSAHVRMVNQEEQTANSTHTDVTVALALEYQNKVDATMRQQLQILMGIQDPQHLEEYHRQCARAGIPAEPPAPLLQATCEVLLDRQ